MDLIQDRPRSEDLDGNTLAAHPGPPSGRAPERGKNVVRAGVSGPCACDNVRFSG